MMAQTSILGSPLGSACGPRPPREVAAASALPLMESGFVPSARWGVCERRAARFPVRPEMISRGKMFPSQSV